MVRKEIRGRRGVEQAGLAAVLDMLAPRFRAAVHAADKAYEDQGVKHALVGGLAVGAYGDPRNTEDVDFLVGDEAFDVRGAIVSFRSGIPLEAHGTPIDSIPIAEGHRAVMEAALKRAILSDEGVPIVRPEYLIYMKLLSRRARDADDVRSLVDCGVDPKLVVALLENEDMVLRFEQILRSGD